jgi:hypothetical protein
MNNPWKYLEREKKMRTPMNQRKILDIIESLVILD